MQSPGGVGMASGETRGPVGDDEKPSPQIEAAAPGVLSPDPADPVCQGTREEPECFRDLNLDQVVRSVTAGWTEYDLTPFFHAPLQDLDAIAYRQEILRDLESEPVLAVVSAFSSQMRRMRQILPHPEQRSHPLQAQRRFLTSVSTYCRAVGDLAEGLSGLDLASRGLRAIRRQVCETTGSPEFRSLAAETHDLEAELSSIRYCVHIDGGTVTVRPYDGEEDYSAVVEATFEKFRQGAARDYRSKLATGGMNHVEAQVLERVALLHPETFGSLQSFCERHTLYLDPAIQRFDREVQFYIAYLTWIAKHRNAGLSFCYPELSRTSKEEECRATFDVALAARLVDEGKPVVCNDFYLRGSERMLVVSGPNQGGKTTFARMYGQVHYLACLGFPIPGRTARLFVPDRIYTHFERSESTASLRGKLEDDLIRMHRILDRATSDSVVIINEIFSSTTVQDALYLGREIMARLLELDVLGVCVTFLDELATLSEATVSVVSGVRPDDPAVRTFRLERRPADGLAYALAIAEKHGVTYQRLLDRIRS